MHDSTSNRLVIALGSNSAGKWGAAQDNLRQSISRLQAAGVIFRRISGVYSTTPQGPGLQSRYLNAVAVAETVLPPAKVLRLFKRIERDAGRRRGLRNGPRPLDLDLVDYGGRRIGWPRGSGRRPDLVLPHPEMHRRSFVLVPLVEIYPGWRHTVLGLSARQLNARVRKAPREIEPVLDSGWASCQKNIR